MEAAVDGGSEVMKLRLRDHRIHALEAAKLSGDDTCLLCGSRDLVKVQD